MSRDVELHDPSNLPASVIKLKRKILAQNPYYAEISESFIVDFTELKKQGEVALHHWQVLLLSCSLRGVGWGQMAVSWLGLFAVLDP